MKAEAYTFLSEYYEDIIDCDYEKWSQYLYNTLQKLGAGKRGLDAGCGTGYFTRAFFRSGLDITGADISEKMLAAAAQKAAAEGLNIQLMRQDIKSLKTFKPFDFVTAINDVVNYLDGGGIKKAFSAVNRCLKKGGLFVFDISTEYKLKNILGNNTFAEDTDNLSYIWFNTFCDKCVIMDLSIFKRVKEQFTKSEERHTQYVHTHGDIVGALSGAGFEIVLAESFLGGEITEKTERILFAAKKTATRQHNQPRHDNGDDNRECGKAALAINI